MLTENDDEEEIVADSSNDEGEKLEVKSGKCTTSSLKSKKILSHIQKRINVLLQN